MGKVAVSEFRANLISFLKRVERGEVISLTSRGYEIAKIVPPDNSVDKAREALKELRKTAVVGDVVSPVGNNWEVLN